MVQRPIAMHVAWVRFSVETHLLQKIFDFCRLFTAPNTSFLKIFLKNNVSKLFPECAKLRNDVNTRKLEWQDLSVSKYSELRK